MLGPKISRGRTRGRFHDFQVGDTEAKPRKSSEVFVSDRRRNFYCFLRLAASENQLIQHTRRPKGRINRN